MMHPLENIKRNPDMSISRINKLLFTLTATLYTLPFISNSQSRLSPPLPEIGSTDYCLLSHDTFAFFPDPQPLICPFPMLEDLALEATPEDNLKKRLAAIITSSSTLISTEDLKQAREHLTNILFELHQNNLVDQCKINDLLSWDIFRFEILTEKDMSTDPDHSRYERAAYLSDLYQIAVPIESIPSGFELRDKLSHELTHAYDAYANERADILKTDKDGKFYPIPYIFGSAKTLPLLSNGRVYVNRADTDDCKRVTALLKKDEERVNRLKTIVVNTINKQKISKNDAEELKKLLFLIRLYDYKPREFEFVISLTDSLKDKIKKDYQLKGNHYVLKPNHPVIEIHSTHIYKISKTALDNGDVFAAGSLAKMNSKIPEYLAYDLLRNLLNVFNTVEKDHTADMYPSEFSAHAAQVLAAYSTPRDGQPTLAEWLLPNLTKHLTTRATDSFLKCMKQDETEVKNSLRR